MKKLSLFILVGLFSLTSASAQMKLSAALGNFKSLQKENQGITINTTNGTLKASVYGANTIRIRLSQNGTFDDLSYSVIANANGKFSTEENNNSITLKTDSLKVVFTKNPVRVRLLTLKDQVVNEDEPAFGTSWIGHEVTTYKKLQNGERFIGLGEKTGPLDRKGNGYINWNTDYFGYPAGADPIYQSLPFYIGVHSNVVYGVFMDNSYRSHFNFGASNDRFASYTAEDGDMDYYLIHHSNVAKIIESYSILTGKMPMPPMWSLGLQQSRYSYYPDTEVKRIAETYREKGIPADAMVLDIHYMDKYKIWTWDKERFGNPKKLTKDLKDMGFNTVVIIDPGIKVEKGYHAYESGVKNDVFAKYPDGTYYTGQVWPGWCHFPDFTKPAARTWWGENFKDLVNEGVEGFWNDMNEPAAWGQKLPDNIEFDFEGKKGTHKRAHNLYGFQMVRASYEGTKKILGRRPFILTRAGFCGVQRYSAVWTGDNQSNDEHMMAGVRLMNSMGLTGVPVTGMDVGGFTGGTTKELFARWVSIGAFSPFFRIHSAIDTKESDPFSYGEKVEAIAKNYVRLRYRLLPYLYSSFYEASQTGMPIQRSLAINYPHDGMIYDGRFQNQFFTGGSIMVAPIESNKEICKVYLPEKSGWYDFYNDTYYEGKQEVYADSPIERLPVFVKGGSIFPTQSVVMHTGEKPSDTLSIHIYKGANGSSFVYYEDDGSTFEHEKGSFYKRNFVHNPKAKTLNFSKVEGSFASKFNYYKIVLHGYGEVKSNGAKQEMNAFLGGLPNFDPIGAEAQGPRSRVSTFVVKNQNNAFSVKW